MAIYIDRDIDHAHEQVLIRAGWMMTTSELLLLRRSQSSQTPSHVMSKELKGLFDFKHTGM